MAEARATSAQEISANKKDLDASLSGMADEMQRFDNAITFANEMLTAKKTGINGLMLQLNLSDLSSNGWRTAEQRHRSALNIHLQMCQRLSKR